MTDADLPTCGCGQPARHRRVLGAGDLPAVACRVCLDVLLHKLRGTGTLATYEPIPGAYAVFDAEPEGAPNDP